ncbi:glycosyltransferase family 4 protein, partial [Vibrio splendidus]|uniref:glycosyltransferase family 4 protein n=1 Tax=Vibrio splendidus TaxID=29497 RepID=UPI0024690067
SVTILSLCYGRNPYFDLNSGILVESMKMENKSSNFSDMEKIIELRRFLKDKKIDIIIDVDVILSLYSIPATFFLKTKVVSWEHFHYKISPGGFFQRNKRILARKLAVYFSSRIVTLTNKDKNQYIAKNINCKNVVTILNPLTIHHKAKTSLEDNVVLAVGRLCYQKRIDYLIKAWAMINNVPPRWKLIIVGSGDELRNLELLVDQLGISNSVEFYAETKNVDDFFKSASIYAMSSRFEGLPLVLIEAKSFGLPIVSFDLNCGPSDIVKHDIDGVLVEDGNIEELAFELDSLMKDKARIKNYSEMAIADDRFGINQVVKNWKTLLDEV